MNYQSARVNQDAKPSVAYEAYLTRNENLKRNPKKPNKSIMEIIGTAASKIGKMVPGLISDNRGSISTGLNTAPIKRTPPPWATMNALPKVTSQTNSDIPETIMVGGTLCKIENGLMTAVEVPNLETPKQPSLNNVRYLPNCRPPVTKPTPESSQDREQRQFLKKTYEFIVNFDSKNKAHQSTRQELITVINEELNEGNSSTGKNMYYHGVLQTRLKKLEQLMPQTTIPNSYSENLKANTLAFNEHWIDKIQGTLKNGDYGRHEEKSKTISGKTYSLYSQSNNHISESIADRERTIKEQAEQTLWNKAKNFFGSILGTQKNTNHQPARKTYQNPYFKKGNNIY